MRRVLLKKIRVGLVGFGLLYSLFLTAYQFFVLSDRCLLCLLSATIVTVMAIVLARYLTQPAEPAPTGKRKTALAGEFRLYGILAVALLVLAGADYGYFSSQAPPGADTGVAGGLSVAEDLPVDVSQCRYDPDKQYYANMNLLVGEDDPITGNREAPITLIEFIDPNCPHCKTVHPVIKAITAKYPERVRVVYKPVAIVGSPTHSRDEVSALYLADEQGKFAEMLDLVFINQTPRTGISVSKLTDFAEDLGMDARAVRKRPQRRTFQTPASGGPAMCLTASACGPSRR